MSLIDLKCCPFCGGHVQLVIDCEPGQGGGCPYAQVVCEERTCGARSKRFLQNPTGFGEDYTVEALNAWNRRVSNV